MRILWILMFVCLALEGRAQTHGHISFEAGIPINDFREHTDNVGAGIKGAVYFPFQQDMPLFFGVGLGYMIFGSNQQEIREVLEVRLGNTVIDEIPIDLLVNTNNNYFNANISVRYKAPLEYVQPYVEARGGLSNFYTRTKVLDNTDNHIFTDEGDDVISSKTQSNSTTYNFGVEGGFIIKVGSVGINIGAAYLMGGRARYYDRSQISQWTVEFKGSNYDPDNLDSDSVDLLESADAAPRKSTTDMVLVNVGVTLGIGSKNKKPKGR